MTVEHYIDLLRTMNSWSDYLTDSLGWWVVRSRDGDLAPADLIDRLGCDPASATRVAPFEPLTARPGDYDEFSVFEEAVFFEVSGPVAVIVEPIPAHVWPTDALGRLSRNATVHGMYWLVNNQSRVLIATDGRTVTAVDPFRPTEPYGEDPHGLDAFLGPLVALAERRTNTEVPTADWETAMATVEAMSGVRLTADWFTRPQTMAVYPRPTMFPDYE